MTEDPEQFLKLEYHGSDRKVLTAISNAEALIEAARQIQNKRDAAGYTRNTEVTILKEKLIDARWHAVYAVAYARKLINQESQ